MYTDADDVAVDDFTASHYWIVLNRHGQLFVQRKKASARLWSEHDTCDWSPKFLTCDWSPKFLIARMETFL